MPTHDENGEFRIPYPATEEIYVFNRYGQHISTRDITTGKAKYTFLYSKNTSFGKLSTVTDSSGNKILFLRDYSNVVCIRLHVVIKGSKNLMVVKETFYSTFTVLTPYYVGLCLSHLYYQCNSNRPTNFNFNVINFYQK